MQVIIGHLTFLGANGRETFLFLLLSFLTPVCTPLPDFTVVQCSSTNVSFAIEWTEPPFQRSGLNFDTICKSLDGSYVSCTK